MFVRRDEIDFPEWIYRIWLCTPPRMSSLTNSCSFCTFQALRIRPYPGGSRGPKWDGLPPGGGLRDATSVIILVLPFPSEVRNISISTFKLLKLTHRMIDPTSIFQILQHNHSVTNYFLFQSQFLANFQMTKDVVRIWILIWAISLEHRNFTIIFTSRIHVPYRSKQPCDSESNQASGLISTCFSWTYKEDENVRDYMTYNFWTNRKKSSRSGKKIYIFKNKWGGLNHARIIPS